MREVMFRTNFNFPSFVLFSAPAGTHSKKILIRYRTALLLVLAVLIVLVSLAHYDILTGSHWYSSGKRIRSEYPSAFNQFRQHHLKVDRRIHNSNAEILRDAQEACPQLPIQFWQQTKNQPLYYKNKSCAPFPNPISLKINNRQWQVLETSNGTFHLFGAYYDARKRSPVGLSVRVLAMIDRVKPVVKTYCQVWFADRPEPVIVQTTDYRLIWWWKLADGVLSPYLITCPLTNASNSEPIFVSIVERMCDTASNSLRVIYNRSAEKKERFAVCVKNLDALHRDMSVRLVEWIELVKMLGAGKIFVYVLHNHENNTKVLQYYEKRGEVEVTSITHAGYQPANVADIQRLHWRVPKFDLQLLLNELISLNDCFYKNMYKYDYITLLDTDEVIMPLKEDNWTDLIGRILREDLSDRSNNNLPSYLTAQNVLFCPDSDNSSTVHYSDIPSYMYMLQHVCRETNHLNRGPKTFFDTETVETVHNHWPISCLTGYCSPYKIATEDAQLHHYRDDMYLDCGKHSYNSSRVNDTTIWRFKRALIDRCLAVLYDLDFFG